MTGLEAEKAIANTSGRMKAQGIERQREGPNTKPICVAVHAAPPPQHQHPQHVAQLLHGPRCKDKDGTRPLSPSCSYKDTQEYDENTSSQITSALKMSY